MPFNLMTQICSRLLYTVQLHALSDTFPHISRHFYLVFKSAPSSFHAEYILGRAVGDDVVTKALRYPLCTMEVFDTLCRHADRNGLCFKQDVPLLPQRLFRQLNLTGQESSEWTEHDHPLPFLKYLYSLSSIRAPDAYNNYALVKADEAAFLPLISFLLNHIIGYRQAPLVWTAEEGLEAVV